MSFASLTLPAVFRPEHYTACYLAAVATYQLLLLREGWRRGFALRPWLLMQAATLLAFVIGCKLVVLPLAEWPGLWQNMGQGGVDLTAFPTRSALGGIAGSSLVLLALRRWLGLGWGAFDAFVQPLALGLAVQCLGCLAAGCCWGEAAGAHALGVAFGPGTGPYRAQVAQGLLPAGAAHALPVVPTQLYALLVCLALAAANHATRRRAWPAGTRYLLGTGAVLLAWGVLCQWRDPASQTLGGQCVEWLGIRLLAVQWAVLAAAAHLAGAAWLLARVDRVARSSALPRVGGPGIAPASTANQAADPNPTRQLAGAAALLALTAALAPFALTGAECRVLQVALGAVLLAEAAAALPALAAASAAWQPRLGLAAALGLLVLTAQAPAPTARPDSARGLDFSLGAVRGGFDQDGLEGATSPPIFGCGGGSPGVRVGREHRYQALGGEVGYQFRPQGQGFVSKVGLAVRVGSDEVRTTRQLPAGPLVFPDSAAPRRYALSDFNPFVTGTHYFGSPASGLGLGYRAGFHVGNLYYATTSADKETLRPTESIMPDAMLWFGSRRVLYGQADAGYGPNSVGNYQYRVGLGSGLGSRKGGTVLAGVSRPKAGAASYLGFAAASVNVPHTAFSLEANYATDFERSSQLDLQLRYRLPLR